MGAGKTTLLKHILETKHGAGEEFRCAVIVNDMAELNIDKSLIDQSALVKSDEVVAMQNGCVCCTLQSDLVDQIIALASGKSGAKFDYMIVEASGVSEPAAIAQLFAECEDDHDHEAEHDKEPVLGDYARLDTCVTVVDAGEFFNNFSMDPMVDQDAEANRNFPKLLVEQIEYSNVVLLNKVDLVSAAQLEKIRDHVGLLNADAKVLVGRQSAVDLKEVLDTKLYDAKAFSELHLVKVETPEMKSCCSAAAARGEPPCCRRARTLDSGKSQVLLHSSRLKPTRHQNRFGLTSFVYKARRPFHPERLHEDFINRYFIPIDADEIPDAQDVEARQAAALGKQQARTEAFGNLLRTKGFVWLANMHDLMGTFGQAGNTVTLETSNDWTCLHPVAYIQAGIDGGARKDWEGPYADRRQELVFIGVDLKPAEVQKALDAALLTDEEFARGVDGWKATIGDFFLEGRFNGQQEDSSSEEEEEEEEEEGAAKKKVKTASG